MRRPWPAANLSRSSHRLRGEVRLGSKAVPSGMRLEFGVARSPVT